MNNSMSDRPASDKTASNKPSPPGARIAVGGENLIDQVITDGVAVSHPGGSPFNVAVAAARQSAPVRYVSPISTDAWGVLLADRLTEAGVTLGGGRNDLPTTMAQVTLTKGHPSYLFQRDGTAERAVDAASLARAIGTDVAALHTGSLTLNDGADADAWEATMAAAYQRGLLTSLDPNVRLSIIPDPGSYRARIFRMIAKVHVLKLSDEDLAALCPDEDEPTALARIRAATPAPLVVLTRGAEGATAWLRGAELTVPGPPADPLVDTVGAGDTFMASLLVALRAGGYLSPQGLEDLTTDTTQALLTRAARAAALNCQREGCDPPTLTELDDALRAPSDLTA